MALQPRRRLSSAQRFVTQAFAPRLRWNEGAQRYVDAASGRFISSHQVREVVDEEILSCGLRMRDFGRALATEAIDINAFRDGVAYEIKLNEIANYAAARGGFAHLTPADHKQIEKRVRRQFQYLERFCKQLDKQPDLARRGDFLPRLRMYAEHGRTTYELSRREAHREAGYTHERNILHALESCEACLSQSARGWVPIGSLRPVGDRTCLTRCKCTIDYKLDEQLVREGGKAKPVKGIPPLPETATAQNTEGGLAAVVREQENRIRTRRDESAHVYDAEGNLIFEKQGEGTLVKFTDEEMEMWKGKDATFTHNHPRGWGYPVGDPRHLGSAFSIEDFDMAFKTGLSEMRAVSPGYRFSLQPPDEGWNSEYFFGTVRPLYEKYFSEHLDEARRSARKKKGNAAALERDIAHQTCLRIAAETGVKYKREKN